MFLGIMVTTIYLDSSKLSGSYATSMVPTSDSDDDRDAVSGSAAFSNTTLLTASSTKDVPFAKKRAKRAAHKAALEVCFAFKL